MSVGDSRGRTGATAHAEGRGETLTPRPLSQRRGGEEYRLNRLDCLLRGGAAGQCKGIPEQGRKVGAGCRQGVDPARDSCPAKVQPRASGHCLGPGLRRGSGWSSKEVHHSEHRGDTADTAGVCPWPACRMTIFSLLPVGEGGARAPDEGRRCLSANAVAGPVRRLTPKATERPSPPPPPLPTERGRRIPSEPSGLPPVPPGGPTV